MKHVLITGCTRGLGSAMARAFASRGWTVSGCGTSTPSVVALVEELGTRHRILRCDVRSPAEVGAFATDILAGPGAPDLLLNNAAVINPNAPLWEVTPDDFSRVIDVNLKGVHLICRAFLPAMIGRGSGVVVNFSSGWGRSTSPEVAPYLIGICFRGRHWERVGGLCEGGGKESEVKVKAMDAELVMEGFQKIANRITTGIVLAALILGTCLLMRIETNFQLMGYPGLAIVCFLAAAAGGFWLVISIFVKDHQGRKKSNR